MDFNPLSLPKLFHFSIFENLFENLRVSMNRSIFEWEEKQKGQKEQKRQKPLFLLFLPFLLPLLIHPPSLAREYAPNSKNLDNDKISIQLRDNTFIFSCLDKYIGWKNFRPEIEKAIEIVENTGKIQKWNRVGLRYISEYPNTDLKECTNFDFRFGLPNIKSSSTAFRSEFLYKGSKVILNLSNQIPVAHQKALNKMPEIIPTSIIDIDVIQEPIKEEDTLKLINLVDSMHLVEKEVFSHC